MNRNRFYTEYTFQISIILLTGLAAYFNSLYAPFHFDDLGITDKSYLWPRAFTSGPRQLVDLTFVANHLLHGENVFGFHLVNLAVHLTAALTLFGLVNSILTALSVSFPTPSPDQHSGEMQFFRRFIPFAAALLFVCHPVQTQAVTYIVQRYASMVTLFYTCSVLVFIQARTTSILSGKRWKITAFSFLSLITGVIALRCKETAYTLPVMLIVAEVFLFKGRLLKNRIFICCMAAPILFIPAFRIAQHGMGGLDDLLYNINHSTREELSYPRSEYLMTQFRVVAGYLRLLVYPVNLNLDYDVPLLKTFFSIPVLLPLLLHLSLLTTAVFLFVRSGKNLADKQLWQRGVCLRMISFGIVWFYLALAVESSIIPILDVMVEHRLYLPSGGAFLALASLAALFVTQQRSLRAASWVVLAVVCCVLTVATIKRNQVWNNDLLLWEDTARKSPNKSRVLANLTAALLGAGRAEQALPLILRTIELSPGFTDALTNLGYVLDMMNKFKGRFDNGSRYIVGTRTVDMRYYNAWFANTRNNLGLAYEYTGNLVMARHYFETATSLQPEFELAWFNLYLTAVKQQDQAKADEAYSRLSRINPQMAMVAAERAKSLFNQTTIQR